jgi:hypothetical protein
MAPRQTRGAIDDELSPARESHRRKSAAISYFSHAP